MAAVTNWAALLEEQAAKLNDKTFVYVVYQDRSVNYQDMDLNANRIANYLLNMGAAPGDGIATVMNNSTEFLDIFFGIQKIGMYVNTVNTSLRGDQLAYTIDNSDTKYLVVDHDLLDIYQGVADPQGGACDREHPRSTYGLQCPQGHDRSQGCLPKRSSHYETESEVR
jgi:crotonobetaine/carnitine-CoA ligase